MCIFLMQILLPKFARAEPNDYDFKILRELLASKRDGQHTPFVFIVAFKISSSSIS